MYLAESGYMFSRAHIPKHAIITALAGKPTPDLATFTAVLRTLPHAVKAPLEYFSFAERHRKRNALLTMDRQWYGTPIRWTKDDAAGLWHPAVEHPEVPEKSEAQVQDKQEAESAPAVEDMADSEPSEVRR